MKHTITIVTAILIAELVTLHKIEEIYRRIANHKMWYWYDQKTRKRIYD